MNNDVVKRIRDMCHVGEIPEESVETVLEAADEIENLRYKISKLKELLEDGLREAYSG